MLLLVLHEGADDEERLQHEGVDGVAVCGAATHHRVRVSRGAHQAGACVTGLHNITLLTQLHTGAFPQVEGFPNIFAARSRPPCSQPTAGA